MTINKPEMVAYLHTNKENPEHRGVSLHHDASCTSTLTKTEPLIRLSDCEGLAEILREAAAIIGAIYPEFTPWNMRWPIIDELEGFALMFDHTRRIEGERE